jgi:hypothetical protein
MFKYFLSINLLPIFFFFLSLNVHANGPIKDYDLGEFIPLNFEKISMNKNSPISGKNIKKICEILSDAKENLYFHVTYKKKSSIDPSITSDGIEYIFELSKKDTKMKTKDCEGAILYLLYDHIDFYTYTNKGNGIIFGVNSSYVSEFFSLNPTIEKPPVPNATRISGLKIFETVASMPNDSILGMHVTGLSLEGNEVDEIALIPVGKSGLDGQKRLLQNSGLSLYKDGDIMRIENVHFGTPAMNQGLDLDFIVVDIQVITNQFMSSYFDRVEGVLNNVYVENSSEGKKVVEKVKRLTGENDKNYYIIQAIKAAKLALGSKTCGFSIGYKPTNKNRQVRLVKIGDYKSRGNKYNGIKYIPVKAQINGTCEYIEKELDIRTAKYKILGTKTKSFGSLFNLVVYKNDFDEWVAS